MPVRPIADAKEVFEPHVEALIQCVNSGYDNVYERCGPALSIFETRTKRSMFRDAIVRKLLDWADRTNGVHFFEKGQLRWVGFANQWIVRVKAIDERDSVAVSPTVASTDYNRNYIPKSIAETLHIEAPATMLYIGHRANENAPLNPEVSLICNNKNAKPEWIWPLTSDGPSTTLALPLSPIVPPEIGEGVRIRVKRGQSLPQRGGK